MDGAAVAAVVDDIRNRYGRIDVLLHAGGLLIDRTLPDKEPQQFNLVFDVKADGFFSLMRAAKGLPIGATVCFSSVAGRFGNNGQSDYSAANDLLCKISSSMRTWRPQTWAIAIDWTAWGSIGMASRGSVPQIMEALGIDMLAPEAGVPTIRRELTYGGTRGEVVVAGRLGAWVEESDPTGGLDLDKAAALLRERSQPLLMVGEVKTAKLYGGLQVETVLDPKQQPFLYDHAPDAGVPWLPGVMAAEAMAETAVCLLPGYSIAAVEKLEMLGAFKFFRMEPRTLYLSAEILADGEGELVAYTSLRSLTKPAKAGLPARETEHFRARVRLSPTAVDKPVVSFSTPAFEALPVPAEEVYKTFFHGPAYQVVARGQVEGEQALVRYNDHLPADSAPAQVTNLMAPRLMELCFQAVALWSVKRRQAMAFPAGIDAVTVYGRPGTDDGDATAGVADQGESGLYAIARHVDGLGAEAHGTDGRDGGDSEAGDKFDVQVVDAAGRVYVDMRGYRTVARPGVAM